MMQRSRLGTYGAIALLGLTVVGIFVLYRKTIIELIQTIAIELRTTQYSWVILSFIIIITSIPPVLGFTFITSLTGFIYGFPGGILPAALGAFIGAYVAFSLIRKYNFQKFIRLSPSKQEKYVAIQEAIEQGGFKMMLLIRLSPIPWPITNMLLSILPTITFKQFMLVSGISCFKYQFILAKNITRLLGMLLEVWIGSQLADLSNPNLPPSAHRIAMMTMAFGVFILVAVAFWLYRLTMRKVDEINSRKNLGFVSTGPEVFNEKQPYHQEELSVVIDNPSASKKEM